MKPIKTLALITLLIMASASVSKAYDFKIVKADGSPNAQIYVSITAGDIEMYAAQELQDCIKKMTGANLTIVRTEPLPGTGLYIVIGEPETNSLIQANAALQLGAGAHEQRIAVRRNDNHHLLFLAGKSPSAALWATYTFLQDYLGVRWLWPGVTGEFIPDSTGRDVKIVGTLSILQTPRITTRSLAIVKATYAPDSIISNVDTWMARNRMNVTGLGNKSQITQDRKKKGFKLRIAGHNVRMDSATLAANPSWAALRSSNPDYRPASDDAQLCWGNAGLQTAVINMIKGWMNADPDADVIHFYPADNQNYCISSCVPCSNLPGNNDVSTRWQEFSKIVIAALKLTHPDKEYWTYAYAGYKPAPATDAAPFDFIGYTLYNVCYRHPFMQFPHDDGNNLSHNDINAWKQRLMQGGGHMGIRGYEYIPFTNPMYVPLVKWETEQMDSIVAKGLTGYLSELRPYGFPTNAAPESTDWNVNRINLYAAARALWSDITPDSILNDWHRTVYGEAQEPMKDYYNTFATFWADTSAHINEFGRSPANEVNNFLDLQKIGQLNNYFNLARNKVEELVTDTARASFINKQIDLESKMLKEWQLIHTYANERADRYRTQVGKLTVLPGISSSAWDTIASIQPFIKWNGDTALAQTVVKMAWDTTDLALQIVNQDGNLANRAMTATAHDDDRIVDDDECIEVLIQTDPTKNEYFRFAVNSKVSAPWRYTAYTKGGTNFDKSLWGGPTPPYIETSTDDDPAAGTWTVNIKIPFAALGITAADGKQFKIMIKRGRATGSGADDSGWPDAAFYRQNHFGTVTLVNKVTAPLENKIILYDENHSGAVAVSVEFQKRDWIVTSRMSGETELAAELEKDAAVLLLRYKKDTQGNPIISSAFYQDKIIPFLNKGRVVILTNATSNVNSLISSLPNLTWRTDTVAPHDTVFTDAGSWLTNPNNLAPIFGIKPVPYSAYDQAGGWRAMSKRRMGTALNTVERPYLLSYRGSLLGNGDGMLVVTTSALGYGGGYEIFGSKRLINVVKLVENLRAEQDAIQPYSEGQRSSGEITDITAKTPVKPAEVNQDVFKVTRTEKTVVYTVISVPEEGNAMIRIMDLSGRQIANKKVWLQKGANHVSVPVRIVPNTIYLANLRMGNTDISVKFLKND